MNMCNNQCLRHVVNISSCWWDYKNIKKAVVLQTVSEVQATSQCRNEHLSRNRSKSPPLSSICSMWCLSSTPTSHGGKSLCHLTKLGKWIILEEIIRWICNFRPAAKLEIQHDIFLHSHRKKLICRKGLVRWFCPSLQKMARSSLKNCPTILFNTMCHLQSYLFISSTGKIMQYY